MPDADSIETKYHLIAIRDALKALVMEPDKATRKTTITYRNFADPLSDDRESISFPGDATRPEYPNGYPDLTVYVAKLVEYNQCFLLTHRLASQITKTPILLLPPKLPLRHYIECILRIVGRTSAKERDSELKYYPRPYVRSTPNKPFVDFAASLILMLTDYVKWASSQESDTLLDAVREEIFVAMRFLIDAAITDDQDRSGWGFVSGEECDTSVYIPLTAHRHVFPTAKAVLAIRRFCSEFKGHELIGPSQELLPKVLQWLKILGERNPQGFYFASEEFIRPWLYDHLYATSALLELHEMKLGDIDMLAIEAIKRLVNELKIGGTADLENPVAYNIRIKDLNTDIQYENLSCLPTCLTVLSRGIPLLVGAAYEDEHGEAKKFCNRYLTELLLTRRNEHKLWPKEFVLINWSLAAIESLLCYELYAEPKPLRVTEDDVVKALDRVLEDREFVTLFRRLLVDQLQSTPSIDRSEY